MTYFNFLETQFVERQKALSVSPKDVTVGNQAKFNAVMSNIQMGRKTVQYSYQLYLLGYWILDCLKIVRGPKFQSSIPPEAPKPPELKVVDSGAPKSA